MNVSRNNCNFILRFLRATLRLAFDAQTASARLYIAHHIDSIPITLETSLHYLGLHSTLVLYTSCPSCSALYDEAGTVPERCTNINVDKVACNKALFETRTRGSREWLHPIRRYSHQPLETWLARTLNRTGVEDLLEASRPILQPDSCTDVWGAPYLNNFPGNGQPNFFDAPKTELRLAFLIYFDFFNPMSNKMAGKQGSSGVVMMACLNFPPEIRYNIENIYAVSVIPGPVEPKKDDINHFIRPIAQNFKEHFESGVWISSTHKYPHGRLVRSAALLESMDLLASRSWGGIGSPSHTLLCSCCYITQAEIDNFNIHDFARRNMPQHREHVKLWLKASSSAQQKELWKSHAARHCEWLNFPWWDICSASTIGPMHWSKNVLEKQLRENMGWSTVVTTGIPSAPKAAKVVSSLEIVWGDAALQYYDAAEFQKSGLTEALLRHLCHDRGMFNAGLSSDRMLKDLNIWVGANIILIGQLLKYGPAFS